MDTSETHDAIPFDSDPTNANSTGVGNLLTTSFVNDVNFRQRLRRLGALLLTLDAEDAEGLSEFCQQVIDTLYMMRVVKPQDILQHAYSPDFKVGEDGVKTVQLFLDVNDKDFFLGVSCYTQEGQLHIAPVYRKEEKDYPED